MIGLPLSGRARGFEPRTNGAIVVETLRSLSSGGDALTLPQLRTLLALPTWGAVAVTSLAENLRLPPSRITRVCTLLVTRGLVIRISGAANDGEVVIALSTAGRRFVDDLLYDPALVAEVVVERGPGTGVLPSTRSA
jgi:DNA-binding MarR family transcriptional regulator